MSINRLKVLAENCATEQEFLDIMGQLYDLAKEDDLSMRTINEVTRGKMVKREED